MLESNEPMRRRYCRVCKHFNKVGLNEVRTVCEIASLQCPGP